jgi:hypothetical protein
VNCSYKRWEGSVIGNQGRLSGVSAGSGVVVGVRLGGRMRFRGVMAVCKYYHRNWGLVYRNGSAC